jgi:hypothetical protein
LVIAGAMAIAMVSGSLLAARKKPYSEKVSAYGFEPLSADGGGAGVQHRAVAEENPQDGDDPPWLISPKPSPPCLACAPFVSRRGSSSPMPFVKR